MNNSFFFPSFMLIFFENRHNYNFFFFSYDSNYLNAWNNKGLAFESLGKYEKAIEWYF